MWSHHQVPASHADPVATVASCSWIGFTTEYPIFDLIWILSWHQTTLNENQVQYLCKKNGLFFHLIFLNYNSKLISKFSNLPISFIKCKTKVIYQKNIIISSLNPRLWDSAAICEYELNPQWNICTRMGKNFNNHQ